MEEKNIPAISVIIPMYNAEKYVAECLESILAQTFTDYEVIVVDDCSTDNSCAVVESYIPKFNGKLQLVRSKINSGGAGTPRNIGLEKSCGEYIFFMDSDDAIIENALEKCVKATKFFDAEIIHFDDCYSVKGDKIDIQNIKVMTRTSTPVIVPTYLTEDLAERVKMFVEFRFRFEPWNHLIRRDFLIKENLKFSHLSIADDMLFSFFLICSAKKIVAMPDLIYIWRIRSDSNSKENLLSQPEKCIHRKAGDMLRSVKLLEEFTNQFDIFKNNLKLKYSIFDFFTQYAGSFSIMELYSQAPAYQFDGLIRRELEQIGESTALTAFIFNRMNVLNINMQQQQNLIQQQQLQIQQLQANLKQAAEYLSKQQNIIQDLENQLRQN